MSEHSNDRSQSSAEKVMTNMNPIAPYPVLHLKRAYEN